MFDHSNTVDKKATKKTLINMFASIKNNGTLCDRIPKSSGTQ